MRNLWFVALAGLAMVGCGAASEGGDTASSGSTATEEAPEQTPEPTPDPEVEVTYSGPDSARSDDVTLKGTVDPANARVRVDDLSAKTRNGRWSLPVTLRRGDNDFQIVATRKGYDRAQTTITVTRKLSSAERAEIRRRRALARANARAVESARNYLSYQAFSKEGLYEQLLFEDFTEAEARYAVENVGANWKKQAVKSAKNYLSYQSFSKQGLIEQLIFEGFTPEEAAYGVERAY